MNCCPHCGREIHEQTQAVSAESLEAWCAAHGHPVYAGGRVSEAVAAGVLGRSPATLRNWRTQLEGPKYLRPGAGRGRISYTLEALADFLSRDVT